MMNLRPNDPFDLLEVPARFDLDLRDLKSAWMRKASRVHPDGVGSIDASVAVNDSYRVLLDPITRADALLTRYCAPNVDERCLPEGFLLAMMELRERADEARGESSLLKQLFREARDERSEALSAISNAFAGVEPDGCSVSRAQLIRAKLNVVRAFDRMLEQLNREELDR